MISFFHRARNSRRFRRGFNIAWVLIAVTLTTLSVLEFAHTGWPMKHANAWLVAAAAGLFFAAYAFKAWGWRRLFARDERPTTHALAAASGAAAVTGLALPGRFDDAIRVAVVRRFPRGKAGIGAVCLSLGIVALIDSAAVTPLASVAAGLTHLSAGYRAGLILVAAAGIGAALIVIVLPRLAQTRLRRFRIIRWVRAHSASPQEATKAWFLVSFSWSLRAVAIYVLLAALGVGASFQLALVFLCATAASTALPIAPAGAAIQAGAGATILIVAGVEKANAIAFAISAQALVIVAGAAVVTLAAAWELVHRRLHPALRPVLH